jgi:hypothetical protein
MGLATIVLTAFLVSHQKDLTLDEVLDLHQQYIDRLQNIEATVETWVSNDQGTSWRLNSRDRWWKEGANERAYTWSGSLVDQAGHNIEQNVYLERSLSDGEYRELLGWNLDEPQKSPPSPANGYHGSTATIAKNVVLQSAALRPPLMLLLRSDLSATLPMAVHLGENQRLERTTINGHLAYVVHFNTVTGVRADISVTLDPAHAFAAVRREGAVQQ